MTLQEYYDKNKKRIQTLLPNCSARFLNWMEVCWKQKLYFIVPETGAYRTEEDQLLLLTQGRSFADVEANYRKLGLSLLQVQRMKNLYLQKKNKTGSIITWTVHSEHRDGKALDALPLDEKTLQLVKDSRSVSEKLSLMEQISIDQNMGIYRSATTMKAGDKAHFTAYDLPIVKKEISKLTQVLLDKKAKRLSISSSS